MNSRISPIVFPLIALSVCLIVAIPSPAKRAEHKEQSQPALREKAVEDELAQKVDLARSTAGLPRLKRFQPSKKEIQLTCSAAVTGQKKYDPMSNLIEMYVTTDVGEQTEDFKLVALGTAQYRGKLTRSVVYADKDWPGYSVTVFREQSSTPDHVLYRVGIARVPKLLIRMVTPLMIDHPGDTTEWKQQVVPACSRQS